MTLKHLSLKLYLHVGISTVSESSATGKSLKTWNDFDIFALLLLLSFLRFYFKLMSLVNVDEAKQDSEPVERSAGDAAALRG